MNTINHMKWAMGQSEYLRDVQEKERARKARLCDEICEAIAPFFTEKKWSEWCDAGPENNDAFLRYARNQWLIIAVEFEIPLSPADLLELRLL